MFSKKIDSIAPSMTLSITQKAGELRAQGHDVLSLSAGEPDFPTPQEVKEAGIRAIEQNMTRYTAVDGLPALKEAIAYKVKRDQNMDITPQEIIVSTGAKQSLFNLFFSLLNPGDEVIIPAPYWVSYPEMVKACEGVPKVITTEEKDCFLLTKEQLENALSDKTKLLVLNSPSNPTGQVYTEESLRALAEVLRSHPQVFICSDDIYEHMVWSKKFVHLLDVAPDLKDRVISINGVSKAYAMTGWRIGWAIAHPSLVKAMKKIQSQSTSNPCSISQAASIAALMSPLELIEPMRKAFEQRHQYLYNALDEHELLKPIFSDGTFYLFVDAKKMIEHLGCQDDLELASYLLEHKLLACVPGSAFGSPGYLRLSFAASLENLEKAVSRLNEIQKSS